MLREEPPRKDTYGVVPRLRGAPPNPDRKWTVGAGAWGVGVSWEDRSLLEVDGGGGCTPWEGASRPWTVHVDVAKVANFYVFFLFYHN